MVITLPYYDTAQAFREAEEKTRDNTDDEDGHSINPYMIKLDLIQIRSESANHGRDRTFLYTFVVEHS